MDELVAQIPRLLERLGQNRETLIRHEERLKTVSNETTDMESAINSILVDVRTMQKTVEQIEQDVIRGRKQINSVDHSVKQLEKLMDQVRYIIVGAVIMWVVFTVGLDKLILKFFT